MSRKTKLDELDLNILEFLQYDASMTNKALAYEIGLSPPATLERVKKLTKQGYVLGSSYDLNWDLLGYKYKVLIISNVEKRDQSVFPVVIQKQPEILKTFKIKEGNREGADEELDRYVSWGVFKNQEDFLKMWGKITASLGNYVKFNLWELQVAQKHLRIPPIL